MGPYCRYCDQRCFVHLPLATPGHFLDLLRQDGITGGFILATCPRGREFERSRLGFDILDIQAAIVAAAGRSETTLREGANP